MRNKLRFSLLLLCTLYVFHAHAAKRYWVAFTAQNWNSVFWSTASGGAAGASVPGVNDTAFFDGSRVSNCNITTAASPYRIDVGSGYTGTITQSAAIAIGNGNAVFSGGHFTGGASSISVSGSLTISGTVFQSTSSTMTISGNFTLSSGSFDPHGGTLVFDKPNTITGSLSCYRISFSPQSSTTGSYTVVDTITVNNTLRLEGSDTLIINTGLIDTKGNVTILNTVGGGGGSATISLTGSNSMTLTGSGTAAKGRLPKTLINKSGGTLTLASIISVAGDWTYTAGTVDASTNTTTVDLYGNLNLDAQGTSSTMSFYNLVAAGNTITLTGNLNVSNNLTINSSTTLSAGSNSISVGGNWSDNGTWTYGTSSVTFNGNGYNTIGKSSGTETFYNLTFNRTTKSQTLLNPVKVNNVLTLTKGHVKTTSTNILELIDNATLSGGGIGAYVHGPVRKTGNDAFNFPLGDTTLTDSAAYHPLYMTAPSSTSDQFDATYFPSGQTSGTTLGTGIASLSSCEYWTFKRVAGSSTPTVSLNWNSNCDNSGYSEMREAIWNGTQWNDLGQSSITISDPQTGKLTAASATSFTSNPAPLTIGYATVNKSYSVLSKTVDGGVFYTDGQELYFGFTEEYKDGDGKLSYSIVNLSNNTSVSLLGNANNNPAVQYGDNRYRIDLYDSSNNPLASGYYMLEVTNEKHEKWYLRFKI